MSKQRSKKQICNNSRESKQYKNSHHHDSQSGSLIGILESFGIIVKTKINFRDRERETYKDKFLDDYMNASNGLVIDCPERELYKNQDEILELSPFNHARDNVINAKKSNLTIKFKCAFDHTKSFQEHCESNLNYPSEFNSYSKIAKMRILDSINHAERNQENVIYIEFDLKFKSIVEVVKYLNLANGLDDNLMLEKEILSKCIEILDVDQVKKQVYFKLKTYIDNRPNNLSSYYLVGKIDGTESCFILDMTPTVSFNRNLQTIYSIYRHFTPTSLVSRIYKTKTNTFHDCKDAGIYRVLIGCFFTCMTNPDMYYTKRSTLHPYDFIRNIYEPHILQVPDKGGGFGIIAEKSTCNYYYYGTIDTGYYKFKLHAQCKFVTGSGHYLSFTREFSRFLFL